MRAGLEDPFERHQKRPLAGHVLDFKKYLQARDRTPRYICETIQQFRSMIAGCKFEHIRDISPSRVWINGKWHVRSDGPLFKVTGAKTSEIIRRDLEVARKAWIDEAGDEIERKKREASSFLAGRDDHGRVVDFHSLRNTFITNLSLSGVQPKAAQTLARHSDINLTMNTYTMLRVLDQAAAVEALPPVPEAKGRKAVTKGRKRRKDSATGAAVSGSLEPPASEDVSQILAAWAQIPADVRERLLASGRVPQGTVAS